MIKKNKHKKSISVQDRIIGFVKEFYTMFGSIVAIISTIFTGIHEIKKFDKGIVLKTIKSLFAHYHIDLNTWIFFISIALVALFTFLKFKEKKNVK